MKIQKNEYIIIPHYGQSKIVIIVDDSIKEKATIDIPYNSKSIITENNIIVTLCFDEKELRIHNTKGVLLKILQGIPHKAIAAKNNTIYIGGKVDSNFSDIEEGVDELFSIINIDDLDALKVLDLPLPIKTANGKSIDDILIRENNLILVDNIVYPKFLFEYDISNTLYPTHIKTIDLPNNGTYEHIIKGDINSEFMAILSSTMGGGGSGTHINVFRKNEIKSTFTFTANRYLGGNKTIDISLIDNYLIILDTEGLGYVKFNRYLPNSKYTLFPAINNVNRIIKTKGNKLIGVSGNSYELISLPWQ